MKHRYFWLKESRGKNENRIKTKMISKERKKTRIGAEKTKQNKQD